MWSPSGLSHVASAVGKPMHADVLTEQMKRIAFARICVEVEASKPLLDNFVLDIHGVKHLITVEYQWKPQICRKCNVFGHSCSEDLMKATGTVPVSVEPTQTMNSNVKLLHELRLGNSFDALSEDLSMEDVGKVVRDGSAGSAAATTSVSDAVNNPSVPLCLSAGLTSGSAAVPAMIADSGLADPAAVPTPALTAATSPLTVTAAPERSVPAPAPLCAPADSAPVLAPAPLLMDPTDPAAALCPVALVLNDAAVLGPAALAASVLGSATDVNSVGSPKTRLQKGRKEKKKEIQSKIKMKNLIADAPSANADEPPSL